MIFAISGNLSVIGGPAVRERDRWHSLQASANPTSRPLVFQRGRPRSAIDARSRKLARV